MRPNIVSEAGLQTRLSQWWESIPFLTSAVVVVCGAIYLVCLLVGYDSFVEICFLPSAVLSHFEVYRIYTSILFHGSLLHVLFNMMALVPLGSELERIMGSLRLLYMTILFATTNAVFHLLIALFVAYNPFYSHPSVMNECGIGFSGILFSMIVVETSLSGVQSRSVFGLFNIPAKLYPWILLVVFQLLMTNVSLLGHLCGILSGFAYAYGIFNFLMPGASFYSAIEASSWLAFCVGRPKFILCTGGNPSSYIPTYSGQSTTSSGMLSGNIWRNWSSWMPSRESSAQPIEEQRFPGRGRTLGTFQTRAASADNLDSNLHARLLGDNNREHASDLAPTGTRQQLLNARGSAVDNASIVTSGVPDSHQVSDSVANDEKIQKLVSMGFDRTHVEVALGAADGDMDTAVEILTSQQG